VRNENSTLFTSLALIPKKFRRKAVTPDPATRKVHPLQLTRFALQHTQHR